MTIDLDSIARKVEVDNRIPLRYYYRIADNLLKQASVYREENNIVDLFIILLRFLSLVSETIPYHRDYQVSLRNERVTYKKRSRVVLDELESLKPEFKCRSGKLSDLHVKDQLSEENGFNKALVRSVTSSLEWPAVSKSSYLSMDFKQLRPAGLGSGSSWKNNNNSTGDILSSNSKPIDKQFRKLSLSIPTPKKDTLSRQSFLGPNGLRAQWLGPSAEIKVQYPSSSDLTHAEDSSLNQTGKCDLVAVKDGDSGPVTSAVDSVPSLDDGRWLCPGVESSSPVVTESSEDPFQLLNIKQPSTPPILTEVYQAYDPICPSKVADPRPGPAKSSQDSGLGHTAYQHVQVCQTLNEEEIFEVQDSLSLFPLDTPITDLFYVISTSPHTLLIPDHVTRGNCNCHGPYRYNKSTWHISSVGVSVIRHCQQRGFHPHEEPSDGSPIYEHCSHVYINAHLKFDVVDLRERRLIRSLIYGLSEECLFTDKVGKVIYSIFSTRPPSFVFMNSDGEYQLLMP